MTLMRPSESSKMLAYIEEIGEEPPASATATQNNTMDAPQSTNKQEEIELQELPSSTSTKTGNKKLEKQRLDSNKIKSDDNQFVVVIDGGREIAGGH